jgi:hypothetical protein
MEGKPGTTDEAKGRLGADRKEGKGSDGRGWISRMRCERSHAAGAGRPPVLPVPLAPVTQQRVYAAWRAYNDDQRSLEAIRAYREAVQAAIAEAETKEKAAQ